jgi:hypothetical protein
MLNRLFGDKKQTHMIIPISGKVNSQIETEEPILPLASNPELDFLQKVSDAIMEYIIEQSIKMAVSNGRKSMSIEDIKKVLKDPININID